MQSTRRRASKDPDKRRCTELLKDFLFRERVPARSLKHVLRPVTVTETVGNVSKHREETPLEFLLVHDMLEETEQWLPVIWPCAVAEPERGLRQATRDA